MGARDSWCEWKGLKARSKGMKKLESKSRKMLYCVLFATSFVIYIVIGGLYAERSINAITISGEFRDMKPTGKFQEMMPVGVIAYDTCSFPMFIMDPEISETEYINL